MLPFHGKAMNPNGIDRIVNGKQKTPELEIYNNGRYFTMTGNVFGGIKPIAERNRELQEIIDLYAPKEKVQPNNISVPSENEILKIMFSSKINNTATAAISTWEAPVPFKSVNLPMFPVNELPTIVSDYTRAVSETTQTSPDMAATAALAILALSLQGKFLIEGKKDWREPLNLYTLKASALPFYQIQRAVRISMRLYLR